VADPLTRSLDRVLLFAPHADPDTLVRLRAAGVQVVTEMPATVPDGLSIAEQVRMVEAVGPVMRDAARLPVNEKADAEMGRLVEAHFAERARRSFGPAEMKVKGAAARRKDRKP
jgi:hypothetical protein